MGLFSSGMQIATLLAQAGAIKKGYDEVKQRLSSSAEVESTPSESLNFDTVVIVAKASELQAYSDYFNEKKLWLKNVVSSGYNESSFDVLVRLGSQVSKEQFDRVQENTSFYQKSKIRKADWFNGKKAFITDILNPRLLKNILTFNYENLESDNLKLIAKILEALYHEYVTYYEWCALGESAKAMTNDEQDIYKGCYYNKEKRLWIMHDENLWRVAIIVTHLVNIITTPNVQCHNDRMMVAGSFGSTSLVPISLYHLHFLNEFLQREFRKPQLDDVILKKRKKFNESAAAMIEKLSKGTSKKGSLVKKMATYAQGETAKIGDAEVANLLNIKALQLIQGSIKANQETSGKLVLANFSDGKQMTTFESQLEEYSGDVLSAQKAHNESLNSMNQLKKAVSECDVFIDTASIGNLFGLLNNQRQTVVSNYFKLHDFQGHLRTFQDYVVSVEDFAQKCLPSEQIDIALSDKSLEYVVKNLPFQLSTLLFPSYPVIDSGIFITTCKEKYFKQMFSSSFEFLMIDEQNLTKADITKLDTVVEKLKLVKIQLTTTNNETKQFKLKVTAPNEIATKIDDLEISILGLIGDQHINLNETEYVSTLLETFKKASQKQIGKFIQAHPEALEALKGFLKEIEVAALELGELTTIDPNEAYRDSCYGQISKFINEFVFGINQKHIEQVSEMTMQMFAASYPEQMPFIQHMFRTRMGLLNQFSKFSSYDTVVHWHLSHSMLYFSTQEFYDREDNEAKGDLDSDTLKDSLVQYFTKDERATASKEQINDAFNLEKKALVDNIIDMRDTPTDFRFLISLCVASIMTDYDRLVELFLVQQALRQLVGLYGNEFIRSSGFKEIFKNYKTMLKDSYERLEDTSRALTKSINSWKETLKKDATRVKIHTNSYQATRKILKLRQRLEIFNTLIQDTYDQLDQIQHSTEFNLASGYSGFCDVLKPNEQGEQPQIYAPQLDNGLTDFYDDKVIKVGDSLKEKRYNDFRLAMIEYIRTSSSTLKDLRNDGSEKPDLVSFILEDQISELSADSFLNKEDKPYIFSVKALPNDGGGLPIKEQVLSNFMQANMQTQTYMQLVLASKGSSLKHESAIREIINLIFLKSQATKLRSLFQHLCDVMLSMYAANYNLSLYVDNGSNKKINPNVIAELGGPDSVEYKYYALCNSDTPFYLSEYLTHIFVLSEKNAAMNNDHMFEFYTTSTEILHTVIEIYATLAINIDFACSRENHVGDDNDITKWAKKVLDKLQIKRLDKSRESIPSYQAYTTVYKVENLKPSLMLISSLSSTQEHQRQKVQDLINYRISIQLTVAEKLKTTQSEYLECIAALSGSSLGYSSIGEGNKKYGKVHAISPLITRKTTRSGTRKSPLFMDVLPNFKQNNSWYQLLYKYAMNSTNYHAIGSELPFKSDSIYDGEKYRLVQGQMKVLNTGHVIEVRSFGGFDKNILNYMSSGQLPESYKTWSDSKVARDVETKTIATKLFSFGQKQALLVQAYLVLEPNTNSLNKLIESYKTNGQFSLTLLDETEIKGNKAEQYQNPNSTSFYPIRAIQQLVDVD